MSKKKTYNPPILNIEKYADNNNNLHILVRHNNYLSHTIDKDLKWKTINSEKVANITEEYVLKWFENERKSIKNIKPYVAPSDPFQYWRSSETDRICPLSSIISEYCKKAPTGVTL